MSIKTIVIDGGAFVNLAGFYEEMNRLFMKDTGWTLGHSLDALNDILYGGFGVFEPDEQIVVIWRNFRSSREALGEKETLASYQKKIEIGHPYNVKLFEEKIREVRKGNGPLLWHIVLEIFRDHKNIDLQLEDQHLNC
jgi:RNAse (barnase) inhibitor barstar